MGVFKRGLRSEALLSLEKLAAEAGDNWWKELLHRWTPSGKGDGLRLAVRKGTLDFYYRGDVVAHVCFGQCKRNQPAPVIVKCHVRYIFDYKIAGQKSATFNQEKRVWEHKGESRERSFQEIVEYVKGRKGPPTRKGNSRKPSEKVGVHAIVGKNRNVIDLEMALPAWAKKKSALRMDIVTLEKPENKIQIAFWEAKTFDDGRLRIDNPSEQPEVVRQLADYKDYVDSHEEDIKRAYAETCVLLKRFHEMKVSCSTIGVSASSLHPFVEEVARLASSGKNFMEKLAIKSMPGLVVFGDGDRVIDADESWPRHEKKLLNFGVSLHVAQTSSEIILPAE